MKGRRHWILLLSLAVSLVAGSEARAESTGTITITPELAGLHPDDIPTGPQETTASLGKSPNAGIYQWGIIRMPSLKPPGHTSPSPPPLLPVPNFIHAKNASQTDGMAWLDYSALYVHPPMMRPEPMQFDIHMTLPSGTSTAWYPHATPDSDSIKWSGVLAGVQAEGPETIHPQWMTARAVTAPATLKVYKNTPPTTGPDDPGTTEGEVFLFARGMLNAAQLPFSLHQTPDNNEIYLKAALETTTPLHAWVIKKETAAENCDENAYRLNTLLTALRENEHTLQIHPAPNDFQVVLCDEDLRSRFTEAFVGSGLTSDESLALSRLVETVVAAEVDAYSVVVLLPQEWTDQHLPLHISGSATNPPVRIFVAIATF